jgi:hypothetical protein
MTKFADQLFDDLMREHGQALAGARVPAQKRRLATRPVLLAAGAGGLAVAATAGALVAGGGTPAYALTKNGDGTLSLAVYQESGIAGANAKLRDLGDGQVIVVPAEAGCPSISSLPASAVPPAGRIATQTSGPAPGKGSSVTVNASGIPAGDILVVAVDVNPNGTTEGAAKLTSAPAPHCVSLPAPPANDSGTGTSGGGSGPSTSTGHGSGKSLSSNG